MAIKLFASSISSIGKSFVSTVSKTVSKVSGGSSSKSSSTNSKSSSSGNKASVSSNSKSSSSGNKVSVSSNSKSSSSGNKASVSSNSKSSSSGNKTSVSGNSKSSSSGNKTSVTATRKTVSSNVSKQSTTTKYVTNAAAIYNASGKKVSTPSSVSTGRPAQSYGTQAKSGATNSQKSTGSATTAKTATAKAKTVTSTSVNSTSKKAPSSVSTGRPAQSYVTQAKTGTTSNQKTVKIVSGNKTVTGSQNRTTNSAISIGRPKESYISQQKASTAKGKVTAQTKLPVPVAQKAPLVTKTSKQKKDPSEASYSNNRPKQSYTHVVAYTPTASREGAGQMFYTTKTDPKALKAGASFATSCIPYVGDVKDIQEAATGKDLITGEKLSGVDRALTITAAGLPVVSGPMLKSVKNGGKIAVEEAPGVIKKAGTLIKKNAPKVKKAANKTDIAEDTAKVMQDVAEVNKATKTEKLLGNKEVLDVKNGRDVPNAVSKVNNSAKLQEVCDIATNYKMSEDTFNNHILERHGANSTYNKSHFNSDFDIKDGIDTTLKGDNFIAKSNTGGRGGYIFEQTFKEPIGNNSKGKPICTLKVVIDESGNVITAFPKK